MSKRAAVLRRGVMRALVLSAALVCLPSEARAFEGLWHVGLDAGYALGGFPSGPVNGFGGGLHVAYGISDVFNLRLDGDVTAFDLPSPDTSAIVYSGAIGAEYLLDVLEWVVYAGALAGPADVAIQDGKDLWQLNVKFPIGLSWMFSPHWSLGFEAQYRLYLFGPEGSPTSNLTLFGRFEHVFGYDD